MDGKELSEFSVLIMLMVSGLGFWILFTRGLRTYRSRRLAVPLLSSWIPFCGCVLMFMTDPQTHQPPRMIDIGAGAFLITLWLCLTASSIRKARRECQPSEIEVYLAQLAAKERADRAVARQARKVSLSEAWANIKAGRKIGRTEHEVADIMTAWLRAQIATEEAKGVDGRLDDQYTRLIRGEISLDDYARAISIEQSYLDAEAVELCGASRSAGMAQAEKDRSAIVRREQWVADQRRKAASVPSPHRKARGSIWSH